MNVTVTGYHIAKTGNFYPIRQHLNGNFHDFRKALERIHESDIYFRISEEPSDLTERIINVVCSEYQVYPDQIFVKSRRRELVEPRMMVQYWLREMTLLSSTEIGRMTGGKDHATVLHAKKKIDELVEGDKKTRFHFINIKSNLS